jgi:hypothetical protein
MRKLMLVTICVGALGGADGTAIAQSGQGGYLGLNPGGHLGTPGTPPQMGSLQGGYLGKNPGGALNAKTPASAPGPTSAPTAWCDGFSMVPGRCRNRAAADHEWCATRQPERYADCRRTLDYMGWPP